MGASYTQQTAVGKTAKEAFALAVRDAAAEYGHQEGYSGAINSGDSSFRLVALPPRMTFAKFQALLDEAEYVEDGEEDDYLVRYWKGQVAAKKRGAKGALAKAEKDLAAAKKAKVRFYAKVEKAGFDRYDFDRLAATYNDKWGGYLGVELKGAERKAYAARRPLRRGEKIFVFFGYAPS